MQSEKPRNVLRVAVQSAFAAALFLGLPAGLVLWLILAREAGYSNIVEPALDFLQVSSMRTIVVLIASSFAWSYALARISGFRPWWKIALASAIAILAVWFSPLSNFDGILYEYYPGLPVHLNYAGSMVGLIGGVTLFVGFGYGLVLKNIKAAFFLGLSTSAASVLVLLFTIFLFDQIGVRVGTGNFAMSKVTTAGLLLSSMAGGVVLGIGFSRFVTDQTAASSKNDSTILRNSSG